MEKRRKKGLVVSPIVIDGRTIAKTFWGKAWCENLESYSDFANRLPRGRTYVRNGSVVHLEIQPGKITALVSGSELYKVEITISALPDSHWKCVKGQCAGQIGSLVELLQGRLSKSVMDVVTRRERGSLPEAGRDQDEVLLPGLGRHVQACRRRHVRRWRAPGREARAALPAPQGRSPGADRRALSTPRRPPRRQASRQEDHRAGDLADVFGIEMAEAETSCRCASHGDRRRSQRSLASPPPRRSRRKLPKRTVTKVEESRGSTGREDEEKVPRRPRLARRPQARHPPSLPSRKRVKQEVS